MKNRRAIFYMVLALLVVVGAHVLLSFKGGTGTALVQRMNLLDRQFVSATRVDLERLGKPEITIEKKGEWRMVAPYSASVDERTIARLIDTLVFGEIDDRTTDQELLRLGHSRRDYGLDEESALRLTATIETPSLKFSQTILIGSQASAGVYAAVEGEDAVYIVPTNVVAAVDMPPEGFRQRSVFPLWADAVVAFDVKDGAGSFLRFVRDGEAWTMRSPARVNANAAKIRKLLDDLSAAEAVDFMWPVGAKDESPIATASLLAGYGLDPDTAVTLTLKCSDGTDRQISFGKNARDGLVYALVQNAEAIVTVDGALRDQAIAGTSEYTDSRLFTMERSAISRLSVSDGETNYLLSRGEDGSWRLDAPLSAPTDPVGVNRLLDSLLALKTADLAHDGITVGVSTSSAPITVSREALGHLRLEDLRSREIMRIDSANVKRIVVTPRGGKPTSVVNDKDRRVWNVEQSPQQGAADADAIDAILQALDPLEAQSIVLIKVSAADLRKYGLETPSFSVAIDQDREDAVRRNLLIGAPAPTGGAFATLGSTDAVFILDSSIVSRLEKPLVK